MRRGLTWGQFDIVQQTVPLVEHLRQMVEPAVVEVEDLVLRLARRDHELPRRAVLVVEEQPQRPHLAEVHREAAALHRDLPGEHRRRGRAVGKRQVVLVRQQLRRHPVGAAVVDRAD